MKRRNGRDETITRVRVRIRVRVRVRVRVKVRDNTTKQEKTEP